MCLNSGTAPPLLLACALVLALGLALALGLSVALGLALVRTLRLVLGGDMAELASEPLLVPAPGAADWLLQAVTALSASTATTPNTRAARIWARYDINFNVVANPAYPTLLALGWVGDMCLDQQ
jgi:hypothetical protein